MTNMSIFIKHTNLHIKYIHTEIRPTMSRFQTESLRQKLYICYMYIYSVMEYNVLILFEIPVYIIILNLNNSLLLNNTWPDISLFWEEFGPSFKKKWITVTPDTLCQDWLNLAQWFWRRRFLEVGKVFLLFLNYFSLVEGLGLHLNKPEFPLLKDDLHQVWFKLAKWFWGRFSKVSMCFTIVTGFLLVMMYTNNAVGSRSTRRFSLENIYSI